MTFPSDYKRVQMPGGTSGVVNAENGLARQLIIDTTNWNIRLMDGVTGGGYQVMMVHDLAAYLQMTQFLPQGTQLQVETDTGPASVWTPSVILDVFQKIANTATAGSWFIKSAAMPAPMRDAGQQVLDTNNITTNGFYVADPSVCLNLPAAIPTSNSLNVAIQAICQSIDNICLVAYIRDGTARAWIRTKTDTVWGAWVLATGVTAADLALKLDKAGGTMSGDLDMGTNDIRGLLTLNDGPINHRDYLINGCFDVWQRNVTQSANGYGSDDRWLNLNAGSTKVHTRQAFAAGTLNPPGNPTYFSQTVVTSVAGAANSCGKAQNIEGVSTLAGKTVTLTFWAQTTTAPKDIAISMNQIFGTGGSPSAQVIAIGAQRVTLGLTWAKYSVTIAIPSIAGKTIGTNGDDYLQLKFWFDAGSNANSQTVSLGQQSGTFMLHRISLCEGDLRKEADPTPSRSLEETLRRCQRYYEVGEGYIGGWSGAAGGISYYNQCPFKVTKRIIPSLTFNTTSSSNASSMAVQTPSLSSCMVFTSAPAIGGYAFQSTWTADAEI